MPSRYEAWNDFYNIGKFAPQPKKKAAPKPPPFAAPKPPDTRKIMAGITPPKARTEEEWTALLNARVKPMEDSLNNWRTQTLGASEGMFERGKMANESLSAVFFREITGGLQGAEAEAYAKANFGSSHIPGQIAALAVGQLNKLTADWDERDWAISSQYLEKMAEIPALREQIRAQVNSEESDDYTRRFNQATLIIEELWRGYDKKQQAYNDNKDHVRADRAQAIQRGQLLLSQAQTAQDYALAMTDITGYLHKPNPKNPSQPTKTNVVAPGSKAAVEATDDANKDADRAADDAPDPKDRQNAVKAREDDFAQTRSYIFRDVAQMKKVPTLEELPIRDQRAVKRGEKKLEDFATLPGYAEAYQLMWDQYGESLMRYSSARGKATLKKRIDTMINKALVNQGIKPKPVNRVSGP